ncbi:M48 family metallopeptidase [Colwellia sp. RSH04]|uniref:tetratricopeptide repeat protein n=1 Tax=Colwellia sp. RSH04 TaxID=2305464 RepID=UPI0011C23400|nr:hypothetical protein [Colwellia sp. RSH04]
MPLYVDDSVVLHHAKLLQWPNSIMGWIQGRFVGLASFSLSQPFSFNLLSIHFFTITFHLANAVLIFYFVKSFFNIEIQVNSHRSLNSVTQPVPLKFQNAQAAIVSFIWLCHPMNSQAVVYISQRYTVVAMFFTLLTIIFFIRLLKDKELIKKVQWAVLCLFNFILALGSKQSVIFLPLFLYLISLYVLVQYRGRLILVGGGALALAVLYLYLNPALVSTLDELTRETITYSRLDYLATQLKVTLTYFGLMFYPEGFRLESDVSLLKFFSDEFYRYLTIHIAIVSLLVVYAMRFKQPLILLTLALLYLGLAVESSFIPIQDLYFEHRMYLPSLAIIFIVVNILSTVIKALRLPDSSCILFNGLLIVVLSYTTSIRVKQWQEPLSFYQRELEKSPESTRAMSSYGKELAKNGNKDKALELIIKSYNLELEQGILRQSNIVGLLTILIDAGYYQDALNLGRRAINYTEKRPKLQSIVYAHLALVYYKMNICGFTKGWSKKALKLDKSNELAKQLIRLCQ